jgi:outer membrane lipopolysaccharide assembly protein LptE/RlpB
MKTMRIAAVALAVVALGAAGCGYALAGRGNTLPATIKVVGIPLFVNHSQTPDIDQVLTQAVREEFGNHGKYTVNPFAEGADAVLTVTINSVTYNVTAFNQSTHQASRYQVIVSTNVEFKDVKENKVLWTNPGLVFRDEYDVNSNVVGADASAFFRQDANALERLSKNFARNIVTSILEAF